jgi:hypothetical protein
LLVKNKPKINKTIPKTEFKWDFQNFRGSLLKTENDDKSQTSEREHHKKFAPLGDKSGLRKSSLNIKLDILEQKKLLLQAAFTK